MASDTKKNKGVSKKEKHKNEEKIDPNDLVVKLTGKQKIYPVKGFSVASRFDRFPRTIL
jgi:hypothetical protein